MTEISSDPRSAGEPSTCRQQLFSNERRVQVRIYLLNSPLERLREIRVYDLRIQRAQTRVLRDAVVQMNEAFHDKVRLPSAVGALLSSSIHEGMVGADEVGADEPLLGVLGYLAEEEENRKAASYLILLEFDASGPIV